MPKRKIDIARNKIALSFERTPETVFSIEDLKVILENRRDEWGLAASDGIRKLADFLVEEKILKLLKVESKYLEYVKYVKEEFSDFELATNLRKGSYLTHFSAMSLNGLTEEIPKTIFVNKEQPGKPKGKRSDLTQRRINYGFNQNPRVTTNIATYNNKQIYLLNGMNTNKKGVVGTAGHFNELLQVTNIERTLLDITVRPVYSGGVIEVLKAYERAAGLFDFRRLIGYLRDLDYVYPYHQAIGFYLERTKKYDMNDVDRFLEFPIEFDFYLTHQIRNKEYSKKWRLYYPEGL
jgi:predicted transcriptional regulator of viral defense system